MIAAIIILAIIAILLILAAVNRAVAEKEYEALKAPGDLIEVRPGEFLHAVSTGGGKYTVLMLSGQGTPFPYADFKALADRISAFCRVIILEYPGYGLSSMSDAPRSAENYEQEISACLAHFGISGNVILMPHSYSGLMAFDHAEKHPGVVCGILGDDASTWHQYRLWRDAPKQGVAAMKLMYFLFRHYGRLIMRGAAGQMVQDVPEDLKPMTKTIVYARMGNRIVESEDAACLEISKAQQGRKYRKDLAVINAVAMGDKTGETGEIFRKYTGLSWAEMHDDLISNPAIQKTVVIGDAGHYIHHTHADRLAELAKELIDTVERSA